VFGLNCAVLPCTADTTLDDFGNGILVEENEDDYFSNNLMKAKDDVCSSSRVSRRGLMMRAVFDNLGNTTFRKQKNLQVSETVQPSGYSEDCQHCRCEEPE
jgi:hypothetical protein